MAESDDDLEVFQQKYEEEVGEIQKRVDRLEHITGIPKEDKEPRATVFHRLDLMEARGDSQGSLLVRVDALEKFQKKVEPKVDDLDKMVLKWDEKLATEMNTIYEKLSLVQGQLTRQLNLNEELDKKNADRFDKRCEDVDLRLAELEKSAKEHNQKHTQHDRDLEGFAEKVKDMQSSMKDDKSLLHRHTVSAEDRMSELEAKLASISSDNTLAFDKLVAADAKLRSALDDLNLKVKGDKDATKEQTTAVQERLDYLENFIGESAEKHEAHMKEIEAAHSKIKDVHGVLEKEKQARDTHHSTLEERVEYLEQQAGDHADHHAKTVENLDGAHKKMKNVVDELMKKYAAEKEARDGHHGTVQERLASLEAFVGESKEKHDKHFKETEGAHKSIREMHDKLAGEKSRRDSMHATLEDRVEVLERDVGETNNSTAKLIDGLHTKQKSIDATVDQLQSKMKGDKVTLDDNHASLLERVDYLENLIGEGAEKHARLHASVEESKKKLNDAHTKLESTVSDHAVHKMAIEDRLDELERKANLANEEHTRNLEAAHSKIRDLHADHTKDRSLRNQQTASVEERVSYLEQEIGDNANKQSKALADLEAEHRKLKSSHDDLHGNVKAEKELRDGHRSSIEERLEYLEDFIGDSREKHDKHLKEIEAAHKGLKDLHDKHDKHKAAQDEHKATMEERIEFLEKQVGDTADNHTKALEALDANHKKLANNFDQLHGRVKGEKDERDEHHATISERLKFLEDFVGESQDKHDKHMRDLQAANSKLKDLHGQAATEKAAREEHHATVEQRLEFLEKQVGDSADKEALKQLEATHKKLANTIDDLHGKVKGESDKREEHHATVAERLDYIENFIGESADKHDKHLRELEAAKGKLQDLHGKVSQHGESLDGHRATMEERLEFLEKQVNDSADNHAALEANHKKVAGSLDQLHGKFKGEKDARDSHHATISERVEFLEKFVGESADKHEKHLKEIEAAHSKIKTCVGDAAAEKAAHEEHKATMEQRLEFLEQQLNDSADNHVKALEGLTAANKKLTGNLDELHGRVKSDQEKRDEHHATFAERLEYLENEVGASADKHEKHIKELESAHGKLRDLHGKVADEQSKRDNHHATMEERMEFLEKQIGDSADKHGKALEALEAAHKKMAGNFDVLNGKVKGDQEMRDGHHATISERLEYLENFVGESADKHEKHLKEIEAAHSKLKDLHGQVAGHRSQADEHHATMEERLEFIEKQINDSADNHTKAVEQLDANHKKLLGNLDQLSSKAKAEKEARDGHHATISERLEFLETFVGESADKHDKHLKEIEAANSKVKDMQNVAATERALREQHHSTLEERIEFLEKQVGDNADSHSKALEALEASHRKMAGTLDTVHGKVTAHKDAHETNHGSLMERVDYLEKLIGESFEKHSRALEDARTKLLDAQSQIQAAKAAHGDHRATMEERLEYLEKLSNTNAEEHARGLEACHGKMRDFQNTFSKEKTSRDQSNTDMESRLEELERQLGEAGDKHQQALDAMEAKHQRIKGTMDDLHGKMKSEKEARDGHHATIAERLEYLESFVGESADKHDKHMKDLEAVSGKLKDAQSDHASHKVAQESHRATMEERLEAVERQIFETQDGHDRALAALDASHKKLAGSLDDLHGKVKSEKETRDGHHGTIAERLEYLENFVGESADKHDKHIKELEAAHAKLRDVGNSVAGEKTNREMHIATMEERLEFLEKQLGDTADNHAKALETLEANHKKLKGNIDDLHANHKGEKENRDGKHSSVLERVDYLERLIGESADRHGKALEEAKAKIADAHGQLAATKNAHNDHKSTIEDRLEYLEKLIGDSADSHAKELETAYARLKDVQGQSAAEKSMREQHHANMEQRLEFLEKQIGDQADNHMKAVSALEANHKKLAGNVTDLGGRIKTEKETRDEHHSTIAERLDFLERFIGESADKHDKHMKEIEAAHSKLRDLAGAHATDKAAKEARHATVEERLEYLEKQVGDTADQHNSALLNLEANHKKQSAALEELHGKVKSEKEARDLHHATLHERVEYLEQFVGESAEKHERHMRELETAHGKLRDLSSSLSGDRMAREQNHATLESRVEFLEKQVGDNAEEHMRSLNALEASHKKMGGTLEEVHGKVRGEKETRDAHHATIAQRLDYLENFIGESAEKHDRHIKELESAHGKLKDIHAQFSRDRTNRDANHSTLEGRLEEVERQLGEGMEKALSKIDSNHNELLGNMENLHGKVKGEKESRDAHHATIAERLDCLESFIGESADKHRKHQQELEAAFGKLRDLHSSAKSDQADRDDKHATVEARLELLEKQVGDSADAHLKAISSLETNHRKLMGNLDELNGRVASDAQTRDGHHATIADRLEYLEQFVGESAEKAEKQMKQLDLAHSKLKDLHTNFQGEKAARDEHHATLEERVEAVEKQVFESADSHSRALEALELSHKKLKGNLDDLHGNVRGEKEARDAHHATIAERLEFLEQFVGESSEKHTRTMRELEAAHNKLKDVHGKLQGGQTSFEERHSSMEERLEHVEKFLGDFADKHKDVRDSLQDLHDHLGDVNTLVRSEHLQSIHQILAAEKAAREAHEQATQKHIQGEKMMRDTFEASLDQHLKLEREAREAQHTHTRNQMDQEQKAREASLDSLKKLMSHERSTREQSFQTLNDLIMSEKAAREQSTNVFNDLLQRAQHERERHRGSLEELLAQERQEQTKHHEGLFDRVDSLERTVGFFDEIARKERDERMKETKRIWDAIDSHTHDLSTTIMKTETDDVVKDDGPPPMMRGLDVPTEPQMTTRVLRPMATRVIPVTSVATVTAPPIAPQQPVPTPLTVPKAPSFVAYPSAPPVTSARSVKANSFAMTASASQLVPVIPNVNVSPSPPMRYSLESRNIEPVAHAANRSQSPRRQETSPREHVVETITCGHTRYGGERHSSATVQLD